MEPHRAGRNLHPIYMRIVIEWMRTRERRTPRMKNHWNRCLVRQTESVSNESSASARDWIDADLWLRRIPGLRLIANTLWGASIPCAAIILFAHIAAWVLG